MYKFFKNMISRMYFQNKLSITFYIFSKNLFEIIFLFSIFLLFLFLWDGDSNDGGGRCSEEETERTI